jgi:hypothetical protein
MEHQAFADALLRTGSFASPDDVLNILYHHWPIETLPKSFSGQGSRCYV